MRPKQPTQTEKVSITVTFHVTPHGVSSSVESTPRSPAPEFFLDAGARLIATVARYLEWSDEQVAKETVPLVRQMIHLIDRNLRAMGPKGN